MEIEIGKQFINNTWRFLAPCLQGHGSEFQERFNRLFKIATCLHDTLVDGSTMSEGRTIYVMFDKKFNPYYFQSFMEYVRKQSYYKGEYCPESEVLDARKQVVILEVPEIHYNTYDNFLKGNYSKMYTLEQVDMYFSSSYKTIEHSILSRKGEKGFEYFKTKLKTTFYSKDCSVFKPEDYYNLEWELPLIKSEEIFNYKSSDTIYFNQKLDKTWQN